MKDTVFDVIAKHRVVPVITIESEETAVELADALLAGGLPVAEITFRTSAAAAVLQRLSAERPQLLLGAGTLLTWDNVRAAIQCGATFGVAPGLNPKVVQFAAENSFPFMPGVCTPSEIEVAMSLGCMVQKFFPAGLMGGLKLLQGLVGPYGHTGVRFMPTGGITASNLAEYLRVPNVTACGGTWIATKEDIANRRWELITERCREVVKIVQEVGTTAATP